MSAYDNDPRVRRIDPAFDNQYVLEERFYVSQTGDGWKAWSWPATDLIAGSATSTADEKIRELIGEPRR
jgi:hypothetical protein